MQSQTTQIQSDPDLIDFGIGQPQLDLLPRDLLWRASQAILAQTDNAALTYGHPQGDIRFRTALADFLAPDYQFRPDPASFITTNGASQALAMIAWVFASEGDTILVEEPTYFLAHQIFRDRGLKIVGVPLGADGVCLEALEEAIEQHRPAFFYTIPTFQNPTGQSMSNSARRALVDLVQRRELLVVADEVYQSLYYTARPAPPLAASIASDSVISVGSFSKILAPGLRLGWIQTSPVLRDRLLAQGLLKSGGGLNPFICRVVGQALACGEHRSYTERLKQIYAHRVELMDARLQTTLGGLIDYRKPSGGYFFWLELPAEIDGEKLVSPARKAGVGFRPGARFSTSGGFKNFIRLSFAHYTENGIDVGIDRLERVLREELSRKRST